jgi:hypothetical protein
MFFKVTDKYRSGSVQYVNPIYIRSLKEFEEGTQISFADGGTLTVEEKMQVILDAIEQAAKSSAQ